MGQPQCIIKSNIPGTVPMDTNLDNQSFEEWVANPPEEYREIFQAIENLHKEMDEGLDRMHQLLFQFD